MSYMLFLKKKFHPNNLLYCAYSILFYLHRYMHVLVVLACFCVHLYVIMLNLIYQWTGLQWNKELIDFLKNFFNCVFLPLFLFSCLYQIILYCKKHHNYNPYIFTLSFEKIFNRCSVNLIHKNWLWNELIWWKFTAAITSKKIKSS